MLRASLVRGCNGFKNPGYVSMRACVRGLRPGSGVRGAVVRSRGAALLSPWRCARAFGAAAAPVSDAEFSAAVESLSGVEVDNTTKLKLYALYKQATVGPAAASGAAKPGMMDVVGKYKRAAWDKLGDMGKDDARAEYVATVAQLRGAAAEATNTAAQPAGEWETLRVTDEGAARTISLNRPARYNALNIAMYTELTRALDAAAEAPHVSVTVLTGAGRYYSSGNDLAELAEVPDDLQAKAESSAAMLEDFVDAFIRHPKPLVAAVNGPAIGIAATTLALCDIVWASHTATFNTPFCALGQSPEACSSLLFPRLMGAAKANELLIRGRKLTAAEACERNLVAEVFEASVFHREVADRVRELAALPAASMLHTKALVRGPLLEELRAQNKAECARLIERWTSDDCARAIAQFMSRKR